MMLHEQYRPRVWEDVVGQSAAVAKVRRVLDRSWGGRGWWISGPSGSGKTTLANLIAAHGAEEFFTEELDANRLTVAKLKDVEDEMRYKALGSKTGKAYIVNESHGLRKDTIRELLVMLERLPEHVVFVFTTTRETCPTLFECSEDDTAPLLSRCVPITLAVNDDTEREYALRAKRIAQAEGIDGLPDSVYVDACRAVRGNMRALLGRVESGQFSEDAEQRAKWRKRLSMLASTKGEKAEAERAELRALLGEGGAE